MASYLCVKINNSVKSFTAKESKEAGKPYLCIKNGYFPLTTETSTGTQLKIKANNTTYRIVETYTTTKEKTITTATTYGTRASTYDTTYGTRSSTSSTTYGTRSSTSNTTYGTRKSTYYTSYLTRKSTSRTSYLTKSNYKSTITSILIKMSYNYYSNQGYFTISDTIMNKKIIDISIWHDRYSGSTWASTMSVTYAGYYDTSQSTLYSDSLKMGFSIVPDNINTYSFPTIYFSSFFQWNYNPIIMTTAQNSGVAFSFSSSTINTKKYSVTITASFIDIQKETTKTTYKTRISTYQTSYLTQSSTSVTGYLTRSSTSVTGYLTCSSTSETGYLTRSSTSETGYLTTTTTEQTTSQ